MEGLWSGSGQAAVVFLTLFFGLVILFVVLWVTLPFGVFGTKSLLRELIAAQRETIGKLDEIRRALAALDDARFPRWDAGRGDRDG